jgi:hypothetical protein
LFSKQHVQESVRHETDWMPKRVGPDIDDLETGIVSERSNLID